MYTEYWGLKKPPFDNVPDPSMYVESHLSVENTVAETLFAIEEGNECLTVIVGDVGLGKTLSLRLILDSIDQSKYKIAFVTNPDMSFVQIMREIVGQLTGKECEIRGKTELLEVFNKLLFETADAGKKVLVFIDEANAISPSNLESLRLLTNMQDDNRNLFTIVLAGQMELAKRLEHPKRANLFQRIGTYNRIEKMETEELVRNYIDTRLKLAGATKDIFTDDAIRWLFKYSENGVPRLINKIAKLCLKAGETNNFDVINGEVVQQIGQRFSKMTGPVVQKRTVRTRPVRKSDNGDDATAPVPPPSVRPAEPKRAAPPPPPPPPTVPPPPPIDITIPVPEVVPVKDEPRAARDEMKEGTAFSEKSFVPEPELTPPPPPPPPPPPTEPVLPVDVEEEEMAAGEIEVEEMEEVAGRVAPPPPPPIDITIPVPEVVPVKDEPRAARDEMKEGTAFSEKSFVPEPELTPPPPPPPPPPPTEPVLPVEDLSAQQEEDHESALIAGCRITIEIPPHIAEQTVEANLDQKRKIAGVLAAQTLEKNPQLTASPTVDPVSVWSEIMGVIMKRLAG